MSDWSVGHLACSSSSSGSACDGDLSSHMPRASWPPPPPSNFLRPASFFHHKGRPHTCPAWFYNHRQEAPQVMLRMWPDVEFLRDATVTHQSSGCSISPLSLLEHEEFCQLWPEASRASILFWVLNSTMCWLRKDMLSTREVQQVRLSEFIQTTFWLSLIRRVAQGASVICRPTHKLTTYWRLFARLSHSDSFFVCWCFSERNQWFNQTGTLVN